MKPLVGVAEGCDPRSGPMVGVNETSIRSLRQLLQGRVVSMFKSVSSGLESPP
jgi:hypothetical protein